MKMRAKMTISREELEKLLIAQSGPNFSIKEIFVKTVHHKVDSSR